MNPHSNRVHKKSAGSVLVAVLRIVALALPFTVGTDNVEPTLYDILLNSGMPTARRTKGKIIPKASTVASSLTVKLNLRDSYPPRTKRQVNASIFYLQPLHQQASQSCYRVYGHCKIRTLFPIGKIKMKIFRLRKLPDLENASGECAVKVRTRRAEPKERQARISSNYSDLTRTRLAIFLPCRGMMHNAASGSRTVEELHCPGIVHVCHFNASKFRLMQQLVAAVIPQRGVQHYLPWIV